MPRLAFDESGIQGGEMRFHGVFKHGDRYAWRAKVGARMYQGFGYTSALFAAEDREQFLFRIKDNLNRPNFGPIGLQ